MLVEGSAIKRAAAAGSQAEMKLIVAVALAAFATCAPLASPDDDYSPGAPEMVDDSFQAENQAPDEFEYDQGPQEEEYEEVDNRVEEEEPRRARRARKPLPPAKHGFDNSHDGFIRFVDAFGHGFEAGHSFNHKIRFFNTDP